MAKAAVQKAAPAAMLAVQTAAIPTAGATARAACSRNARRGPAWVGLVSIDAMRGRARAGPTCSEMSTVGNVMAPAAQPAAIAAGGSSRGILYCRRYSGNVSSGVGSTMVLPRALVSVSTPVKTFFHTVPLGRGGRYTVRDDAPLRSTGATR